MRPLMRPLGYGANLRGKAEEAEQVLGISKPASPKYAQVYTSCIIPPKPNNISKLRSVKPV